MSSEYTIVEAKDQQTFLASLPLLNTLLEGENQPTISDENAWNSFQKAILFGYRHFCALNAQNETLGVIGLKALHDPLDTNVSFEINNFIVLPDRRRQKIGTALMKHVMHIAKDQNPDYIRLMLHESNTTAINFYNNQNFKKACDLLLYQGN